MLKFDIQTFADDNKDQFGTIQAATYDSDTGRTRTTYTDGSVHEYKTGLMTGLDKRRLYDNQKRLDKIDALITAIDVQVGLVKEAVQELKDEQDELADKQTEYVKSIAYNEDGSDIIARDGLNQPVFTLSNAVADKIEIVDEGDSDSDH